MPVTLEDLFHYAETEQLSPQQQQAIDRLKDRYDNREFCPGCMLSAALFLSTTLILANSHDQDLLPEGEQFKTMQALVTAHCMDESKNIHQLMHGSKH